MTINIPEPSQTALRDMEVGETRVLKTPEGKNTASMRRVTAAGSKLGYKLEQESYAAINNDRKWIELIFVTRVS